MTALSWPNSDFTPDLRFLLGHVVAEYESEFSHGPELILVQAFGTEHGARRVAAGMNVSDVPTEKQTSVLEGRRHSERRARTARTEHQIDDIRIFGAAR